MRILIIEDEIILSETIAAMIISMGHETIIAKSYNGAIKCLSTQKIDFAFVDIHLNNSNSGIEIALWIEKNLLIPYVFISSSTDAETLGKVKNLNYTAFLTKPVKLVDLKVQIELNKPSMQSIACTDILSKNINYLNITRNDKIEKILFRDIEYVESNNIYCIITCGDVSYQYRSTLSGLISELNSADFMQVHRSFVVNISKIREVRKGSILVRDAVIPLSRNNRKRLTETFRNFGKKED